MNYKLLIILKFLITTVLSQNNECPHGWLKAGKRCVKTVLQSKDTKSAMEFCQTLGYAELVGVYIDDGEDVILVRDLSKIINNLYHNGLKEDTWIVGDQTTFKKLQIGIKDMSYNLWTQAAHIAQSNESLALTIKNEMCCKMVSVSSHEHLPFICALPDQQVRKLLFEESIYLGSGPTLLEMPNSHYYYSSFEDNSIKIKCRAIGTPTPKILWYKGGVEQINVAFSNYSYTISGGSLIIPIKKEQRTIESYHCVAVNLYGAVRSPSATIVPTYIDNFRMSRLTEFSPSHENKGSKFDCQAPKHYPKSYSYSWLHSESTKKFVAQDERVFISMDGTLYFSYNIKSDAKSYSCLVAMDSLQSGQYGPFFKFVLPQQTRVDGPEHGFAPVLEEYKPQIFPENPIAGKAVYIECFAFAFPAPIYKWSRLDGNPLPIQSKILNFGRILKIENVTQKDSGSYICSAENSLGTDSSEVVLNIRNPPRFVQLLHDINTHTNRTLKLKCGLLNYDANDYLKDSSLEWFKNGIPISPLLMDEEDSNRFEVNEDQLTIYNTQLKDTGTYQCISINEIFYDTTYAFIRITDFAPKFYSTQFPKKIVAIKGRKLDIPCWYVASPSGQAVWKSLETNQFVSFEQNDIYQSITSSQGAMLHFKKLEDYHAGYYECFAENRLGSASATLKIVVINKPTIHISSLGYSDEVARLKCEVEMFCDESNDCPESLFNWHLNDMLLTNDGSPIGYKTKINIKRIAEQQTSGHSKINQISILELSGKFYKKEINRFSCQSVFGSAVTEIKHSTQFSNTYFPMKMTNLDVRGTSIAFDWEIPDQMKSIVKNNKNSKIGFEYLEQKQDEWIVINEIDKALLINDSIYLEAFNLTTDLLYKFRVLVDLSNNQNIEAESNQWIKLHHFSHDHSDFWWSKLKDNVIEVNWNFEPKSIDTSVDSHYNVSWSYQVVQTKNGKTKPIQLFFSDIVIGRTKKIHFPINGNDTRCRNVLVQVKPFYDGIESSLVLRREIRLSYGLNGVKAKDVKLKSLNSTHLKIDWNWDSEDECNQVYGTKIICYETNILINIEKPITQIVSGYYTSWVIGDLIPESTYNCTIVPIDENGSHGETSEFVSVLTLQQQPLEIPRIINTETRWKDGNVSILLHWSPISLSNSEKMKDQHLQQIMGYIIKIYESMTTQVPIELKIPLNTFIRPDDLSVELKGLNIMYTYKIEIAGYNNGGVGKSSLPQIVRIDHFSHIEQVGYIFNCATFNIPKFGFIIISFLIYFI